MSERAAAEGLILERLGDIIAAQIQLAIGLSVREVDEDTGAVDIFTKAPDHKAGAYLIDRILGKPGQTIAVDMDPDGQAVITADALTAAAQELAAWRELQNAELTPTEAA